MTYFVLKRDEEDINGSQLQPQQQTIERSKGQIIKARNERYFMPSYSRIYQL